MAWLFLDSKALAWLDEAIYLEKKVLIHCRLGIGRTGTFLRSYFIRRGFGSEPIEERLRSLLFPITHVISGKYIEDYFALLSEMDKQST